MLDDAVGTKFEKILLFDKLQPQRAYLKRFMVESAAAETVCAVRCIVPGARDSQPRTATIRALLPIANSRGSS
jgi:hypothetical protein